ncbi:hypothetical protein CSKR_111908 [Clonorchis sinensis]|uniref:Uncharacterized protein n=1 Tax=Clonorchis sinensis TaxID=79923 RepID=A0A3R7G203_CLOSI|nr:hypothetical protein CSKR_111908 [Clonorchis sinensis]
MYRDSSNMVAGETWGGPVQHIQLPENITSGRFSWVPGFLSIYHWRNFFMNIWLCDCITNPLLRTTTLPNNVLMTSPRLVMKRLQSNCPAQRTGQRPPSLPELPTFSSIVMKNVRLILSLVLWCTVSLRFMTVTTGVTQPEENFQTSNMVATLMDGFFAMSWNIGSSGELIDCWSVRRAWQLDCKRFITNRGDIVSATQPRTDDVTSIGDETFAIQVPSSANGRVLCWRLYFVSPVGILLCISECFKITFVYHCLPLCCQLDYLLSILAETPRLKYIN